MRGVVREGAVRGGVVREVLTDFRGRGVASSLHRNIGKLFETVNSIGRDF